MTGMLTPNKTGLFILSNDRYVNTKQDYETLYGLAWAVETAYCIISIGNINETYIFCKNLVGHKTE